MNDSPAAATVPPQSQVHSGAADFRQLFGGSAVVSSASPAVSGAAASVQAPFVPAFRNVIGAGVGNDGRATYWELNHTYFATRETAQWIANKYGTGQVIETPFGGSGGPFSASANEYQVRLADGRLVNAGILAGYYERNPEDKFPGLADKLIRSQLGLG